MELNLSQLSDSSQTLDTLLDPTLICIAQLKEKERTKSVMRAEIREPNNFQYVVLKEWHLLTF